VLRGLPIPVLLLYSEVNNKSTKDLGLGLVPTENINYEEGSSAGILGLGSMYINISSINISKARGQDSMEQSTKHST